MNNINRSFMAIHQATVTKAAIYCQQGEVQALAMVLQEYGRFIGGTVVENAEMLSQCDSRDNGKTSGIWKKRASLKLDVQNIVTTLRAPESVLYIEGKGDSE